MFQKDMKKAYLLDFYGEVLDEHTRSILRAYYEDDLSLSEIAEDEGISRQGVRHIIKKARSSSPLLRIALGFVSITRSCERLQTHFPCLQTRPVQMARLMRCVARRCSTARYKRF